MMQPGRYPETPLRGRLAAALFLALVAASPPASAQKPDLAQRAAMSRAKGDGTAPVLVYEIADFQCPYCARFSKEIFPDLDSAYVQTGKVQWVFVNLPLPMHRRAWAAAEAALCAGGVADAFWGFHDRLFETQPEWATAPDPLPVFVRYARESGIPVKPFRACIIADEVAQLLLQDVVFAASVRVNGTPSFIIDGARTIVGLKSLEEWRELLDAALKARGGRSP